MITFKKTEQATMAGAMAVLICAPEFSLAQDSNGGAGGNVQVLSTIVVEGGQTTSANGGSNNAADMKGYVARSTGTGSKSTAPIQEIPQSVSVISRQEMDDQGAQTTDEALRYTAGVYTQPFGPDSDTNWFYIRGFQGTQTGAYLDGLQLFGFGFGAFYVDSFNLDRIDVLRGPASVLYGGSNPGGIVNYISKKPTGERLRYLEAGINDAGTAYVGFDIGDTYQDIYDFRVSGRLQGGDGYFDFQEGTRGSVSPSFTWRPNQDTSLTLLTNATIIDEVHGAASFLPFVGTVERASFGNIRRDANYTEPDLDKYLRRQFSVGYEFEHSFENNWTVRQNARYGYSDLHEFNLYPFGYAGFSPTPDISDPEFSRIVFEHDTTINNVLVDTQFAGQVETGAIAHNLLVGTDYNFINLDQVQASAIGSTISVTDPQYGAAQPVPVPYIDQTIEQHRIGVYLQDRMNFGDGWTATLNGRYDYVDTRAVGIPENNGSDHALSGRAGLAYTFDNGITPYASAATFFNPLIGSSSRVDFYEPETGVQYEAGLKYQPVWLDGLFTLAYFDITRQNVVSGSFGAETQIGEVRSRGVEFEARANVTEDLNLIAAVTVYDLEITKDADASLVGNTPNTVPEQFASLWANYTVPEEFGFLEGVSLGGGIRYQGESWVDNANTAKVPSATLFDAKVGYKKENWGVDLNVTNIADKRYVASCTSVYACSYGEGRSFKLRAYAKW